MICQNCAHKFSPEEHFHIGLDDEWIIMPVWTCPECGTEHSIEIHKDDLELDVPKTFESENLRREYK